CKHRAVDAEAERERQRDEQGETGPPDGGAARAAEIVHATFDAPREARLAGRPMHGAAADEMQVNMEDRLAGLAVRVEHRTESAGRNFALLRNRRRAPHD